MSAAQLCFDFGAAVAAVTKAPPLAKAGRTSSLADERAANLAYWARQDALARKYWRAGMVTNLPLFCDLNGIGRRYTQMLPGVIESIDGDLASVRIYAAPEYGYRLENYEFHMALAINVPLRDLDKYHGNSNLRRLVDAGLLATGDADLAAGIRARETASVA